MSLRDLAYKIAQEEGINPDLFVRQIEVESAFNPQAKSSAGAMGLAQLMPATAKDLGVTNPYDPEQSLRGGARYMKQLLGRYNNNQTLAHAAYNAGMGNVDKAGGVPNFKETQNYIAKILGGNSMIGAQAPQQMAQQEKPRGLLGGMIDRDFADQLYMAALAGSPNAQRFQPLIQSVQAGRQARREDAKEQKKLELAQKGRNATADYLDSIGQTDLGNLVRQGAITGANALSAVPKPDVEKRTAAMKEYELAQADPKFLDFLKLKEVPETPAGLKKLDEQFATTLSGTSAQALAAARQDAASISSVLKQLEGGAELTGPIIGSIPENLRAILNPESVQAQQLVESVVQKNLRAILGGQFAQKEGEQLVRRAYNPLLPEPQNAARLRALLLSLDAAAQNKQAMEDYFYKNNYSLRGYSGPMGIPSMDEFEAAMEAAAPSPKGSITTAPSVGAIEDGYRFKGGDPSDVNNWEKI